MVHISQEESFFEGKLREKPAPDQSRDGTSRDVVQRVDFPVTQKTSSASLPKSVMCEPSMVSCPEQTCGNPRWDSCDNHFEVFNPSSRKMSAASGVQEILLNCRPSGALLH